MLWSCCTTGNVIILAMLNIATEMFHLDSLSCQLEEFQEHGMLATLLGTMILPSLSEKLPNTERHAALTWRVHTRLGFFWDPWTRATTGLYSLWYQAKDKILLAEKTLFSETRQKAFHTSSGRILLIALHKGYPWTCSLWHWLFILVLLELEGQCAAGLTCSQPQQLGQKCSCIKGKLGG